MTLLPGDLLFYDTGYSQRYGNRASHVAIYIGNGRAISALNESDGIAEHSIESPYWTSRYLGARRLPFREGGTGATGRAVTASDDFRALPTITADRFCAILGDAKSPMASECRAIHAAVNSRPLPLAQSWMESRYGADPSAQNAKNPLGLLTRPGKEGPYLDVGVKLLRFGSWAEAFAEWAYRVDTPDYKDHVYRQGMTLKDYIYTYVGGPGCASSNGATCANGETGASVARYLEETVKRLNRYYDVTTPPPPVSHDPAEPVMFGRVPPPQNFQRRTIAPGVNGAYDKLGPRIPRGLILHRMLGTLDGTDSYFRGEARNRALTDFGIGLGKVYRWTDPAAAIAPWASGPANGIDGDGTAFWQRYRGDSIGSSIFNRDCEAIEIAGNYRDPVPDQDYRRLVELVAWRADAWLRIPWQQWPVNNDGVHCLLGHSEVTDDKECPGPVVYGLVARLIEDVRQRLRSYQEGAA